VLGDDTFTLTLTADGACSGTRNATVLFQAEGTLRVVTDAAGAVTEIWGIHNTTDSIRLALPDAAHSRRLLGPLNISLSPNAEWAVTVGTTGPTATIIRETPFYPPF